MTQKIQLGFAVCRLTHTPKPDYAENHQLFLKLAIGDDLNAMLDELDAHLPRGLSTIRAALRGGAERDPAQMSVEFADCRNHAAIDPQSPGLPRSRVVKNHGCPDSEHDAPFLYGIV